MECRLQPFDSEDAALVLGVLVVTRGTRVRAFQYAQLSGKLR